MCSACSGNYENPQVVEDVELTPEERSEQLIKSAAAAYYHVHVCQQIQNYLGPGEPLDILLRDVFYRSKFHLKPKSL
jgi:hypothetical protein